VEGAHFTPEVENLIRGRHGSPAIDIDYTLRAFPNHHRALLSMMNAGFKLKTDRPPGSSYTMQCWFERAIVYRPDDSKVYMLFGIYLLRKGYPKYAVAALTKAQELATEDSNLYYNMGLAYFALKDYDKALSSAHQAYRLGFPLPGLRDMLRRVGKWQDPSPPTPIPGGEPAGNAAATVAKPSGGPAEEAAPSGPRKD
jgi:tetratricopeptide (TPR) repeat protein